jgi:uncharacterized protein YecE (DUF72 family)
MAAVRVGCCGFPKRLGEYARHLGVVEVQQTFYDPPRPETAARWRASVPEAFEFTLKAWQLITHPPTSPTYRRLRRPLPPEDRARCGFFQPTEPVLRAWERTRELAEVLQARVVVFQCPSSFKPTPQHVANLRAFFQRIDRGTLLLAWEPRGPWPPELTRSLCEELRLIHCVDPFVAEAVYGSPRYFRLHGRGGYRYRYTDDDLRTLLRLCAGETYVLFNNLSMWEDALRFRALLEDLGFASA